MTSRNDAPFTLSVSECWEYLREAAVGRLAVLVDGHPEIFPINFTVDRGSVVFRTASGTKLAGALEGGPVAFEVDGHDDRLGSAWSVVLKGTARQLESIEEVLDSDQLPIFPWQDGDKNHFVRIEPAQTDGRRFMIASSARRHIVQQRGSRTE